MNTPALQEPVLDRTPSIAVNYPQPKQHRFRVVKVTHGYPPRFNAGTEVYSQTLCHQLARRGHSVWVFTREEDPFAADYTVRREQDPLEQQIEVTLVNMARARDGYRHAEVDAAFADLLDRVHPDVIHVSHLNHLSTSLVAEAKRRGIPLVFTAHDFWPLCPRGQFIRMYSPGRDPWALCPGQRDTDCAKYCYCRYFSGDPDQRQADEDYWTQWVAQRMAHMREVMAMFDVIIAPSRQLMAIYRRDLPAIADRLLFLDYGFDHELLRGRYRTPTNGGEFVFGYIGTHIPAKGVDQLIQAFAGLQGRCRLRIYGRYQEPNTRALKHLVNTLARDIRERIEWCDEYCNQQIVKSVFNHVDAIVVPSIWLENSPLVIHEALQARVGVITANAGGMAEFVRHEENGLLFRHRDVEDLRRQMQRFVDDPLQTVRLAQRGYLDSQDGNVPDICDHADKVTEIYRRVIEQAVARGEVTA